MTRVFFLRVRAGVVTEKGQTDAAAFAAMLAQSDEYRAVTRAQYASINLGDPAP